MFLLQLFHTRIPSLSWSAAVWAKLCWLRLLLPCVVCVPWRACVDVKLFTCLPKYVFQKGTRCLQTTAECLCWPLPANTKPKGSRLAQVAISTRRAPLLVCSSPGIGGCLDVTIASLLQRFGQLHCSHIASNSIILLCKIARFD